MASPRPRAPAILLVALLALLAAPAAHAVDWSDSDADDIRVSLITAGPGHNEGAAWYGHSGFLVEDDARGEVRYYHYRLNIPDGPFRTFQTALGHASFHLFEWRVSEMYGFYGGQGRDIRATPLLLPPEDAAGLATALQDEVRGADWIVYHAVKDNCSTRIRDHLDAALHGRLREATENVEGPTLREHVRTYMAHAPGTHALTWFALSGRADEPLSQWDNLMMPLDLMEAIEALHVNHGDGPVPVAGNTTVLLEAGGTLQPPAPRLLVLLGPAIATALAVLLLAGALTSAPQGGRPVAWAALAIGGVLALPAVFLLVLWPGAINSFATGNENLLLVSPVLWLLPFGAVRALRGRSWALLQGTSTGLAVLALLALALKAVPAFNQENLTAIATFLPLYLALAVAVRIADPEQGPILEEETGRDSAP